MAIPLLALVVGATFFFGFAMTNQQHVKVADRYAAWAAVRRADSSDLNGKFFADRARNVQHHAHDSTDETRRQYAEAVNAFYAPAGPMTAVAVTENWPRGRADRVSAEFPSSVGLWQQFTGAIEHSHHRDGSEWVRGQADLDELLAQEFLVGLDGNLQNIGPAGQRLGTILRNLYRSRW